ncbi:MAG: hypothetical protein AAFO95_09285 [Cyanobacteria bacterium J06600_6]
MSEANHNANSFDIESIWYDDSDLPQQLPDNTQSQLSETDSPPCPEQQPNTDDSEPLTAKMDWQRVAHKLREYNRKLLKKVFRLEQELAEIDNKFNKHVEKSENTDSLLVRQAEELEESQAKIALSIEKLANAQQQLEERELVIKQISEQHELSQQQAAQLERECTLLQEKCNQQTFDIVTKEQENQALQSELDRQQHSALQQSAELKRYQEAELRKEQAANRNQNYPHNRYIQPWSNSAIPEPKIALPKTKIQGATPKKTPVTPSSTVQTAAEIATWSASAESLQKIKKSTSPRQATKTKQIKKPQSLAAVDLPTFPRPK